MSLAGAKAALDKGDHATALQKALAAWFACKHERIVAVIEALSSYAAQDRAPPGGKTVAEKQAAWLALEAKRDPSDLEHLLATLPAIKRTAELEVRLARLARRLPDPRISKALHALIAEPPLKSALKPMLDIVAKTGDPRSDGALEHLVRHSNAALRSLLRTTRASVRWQPGVLSSAAKAHLTAIERSLAARAPARRDLTSLFAAVYADLGDDGARSVLADALQEVGDPRGEFIALQLARGRSGERKPREAALWKRHGRDWLEPIAAAVDQESVVFERGFLAKCRLQSYSDEALAAREAWKTVEEVEVEDDAQPFVDAMPALRVLSSDRGRHVPSHPHLQDLSLQHLLESEVTQLCSRALPSLRSLAIVECHNLRQMSAFLGSTLASQLRSLSVSVWDPEAWIAMLATRRFERAVVHPRDERWTMLIEGDRITCTSVGPRRPKPEIMASLARCLASVPAPAQWHVTLGPKLDGLQSALKLFASVTVAE